MALAVLTAGTACGKSTTTVPDNAVLHTDAVQEKAETAIQNDEIASQTEQMAETPAVSDAAEPNQYDQLDDGEPLLDASKYEGEWMMYTGGGYNLFYIHKDGSCTKVTYDGNVYPMTIVSYENGIIFDNGTRMLDMGEEGLLDENNLCYIRRNGMPFDCGQFADYEGIWQLDAGAGMNTMKIFCNGAYSSTSADGSVTNGVLTADETGIKTDDINRMDYIDGKLVDMAGFQWEKTADSPF